METYFAFWTVVMFTLTIFVTILGFGLMQWSMNRILERMDRTAAEQSEAWQRLFTKADNTERMTQEILMRLAEKDVAH